MSNSAMANSGIINYCYLVKELSVAVEVGMHYSSDLEYVERVTLEVAREILATHKWGVPDYEAFVVYHTFDSASINFTVMLRTQEYINRFFIKSEFIRHCTHAMPKRASSSRTRSVQSPSQEGAKFYDDAEEGQFTATLQRECRRFGESEAG